MESPFKPGVMCWVKPGIPQAGLIVELKRPAVVGDFLETSRGQFYRIKPFGSPAWVVSNSQLIPMDCTYDGGFRGMVHMKEAAVIEKLLVPISNGGLDDEIQTETTKPLEVVYE